MTRSGVTNSMVDRRGPALSTSACATPRLASIWRSLRHAPATSSTDCKVTTNTRTHTPVLAHRNAFRSAVSGTPDAFRGRSRRPKAVSSLLTVRP